MSELNAPKSGAPNPDGNEKPIPRSNPSLQEAEATNSDKSDAERNLKAHPAKNPNESQQSDSSNDAQAVEAAVNAALNTTVESVSNLVNDPIHPGQSSSEKQPIANANAETESAPKQKDQLEKSASAPNTETSPAEVHKAAIAQPENSVIAENETSPNVNDKNPSAGSANAESSNSVKTETGPSQSTEKAEQRDVANANMLQESTIKDQTSREGFETETSTADKDIKEATRPKSCDEKKNNKEAQEPQSVVLNEQASQSTTPGATNEEQKDANEPSSSNVERIGRKPRAKNQNLPKNDSSMADMKQDDPEKEQNSSAAALKQGDNQPKQNLSKLDAEQGNNETNPESSADDANQDNDATVQGDTEKSAVKNKKRNRRKSKSAKDSMEMAAAAPAPTQDDTETAEIKQRIKQFGNEIRSAAAVGKSQTEADAANDGNPVTTSRRLSADAIEFVPSSMNSATPQTTSTLPLSAVNTPDFVAASGLPPTAVNAPEFVPNPTPADPPSEKPTLTRPKSVKDIITKFDNSAKEPEMPKQHEQRRKSIGQDSNGNGSDQPKDAQKLGAGEGTQAKESESIPKTSSGSDPKPQTSSEMQARIQQFSTAKDAPQQKPDDRTQHVIAPKHKTAVSLDDINLDVAEEEVLEAPSPSVQLVKKPTADPNDKGLHQRPRAQAMHRQASQDPKPAELATTTNTATVEKEVAKAMPADTKDSLERVLMAKISNEPRAKSPPVPFISSESVSTAEFAKNAPGPSTEQNNKAPEVKEQQNKVEESKERNEQKPSVEESKERNEQKPSVEEIKERNEQKPAVTAPVTDLPETNKRQHEQLPASNNSSKSCCVII